MNIRHLFRHVAAAVALLAGISGVSMATSLKLPSPAELSGKWRLFTQAQPSEVCELQLNTDAPQLGGDPACATRWLSETPIGWFPTPDGLAFTGKEGTGLIHFNHMGNQLYQARLPGGDLLTLARLDEQN
ncbi:protease inhibitor Inh/omp19 family protein [Pseudomonas alliivorans]|uniref:protease inhibitor Inh/omp19 family protein n=1 Tax=Pseudomonas TaxID=286 RepID=UPI000C088434|nr:MULTISPECIES: protease inhibitor Inh/omp19 family protein [Pseudomonas]MBP0951820.1 protease inhibitor Inh/omp19 family protein [Pseudomonas alliivorans]MEE4371823.1 protease inhibitor Inh/omp19 family protein [Pseudomonas alliivorans]MEE4671761.1 protease inhibitor Inh/omp19 family protein [Pseudomonas alliivorans]MEE4692678.1 protease inhibitor Inh/omp19 family protein [Pseudomonas alliivorans]MEE4697983.1 protease inhibitor Inh/omp19 family protein [Pseudomonas alliivorans]